MTPDQMIFAASVATGLAAGASTVLVPIALTAMTSLMVRDVQKRLSSLGLDSGWVAIWGPIWIVTAVVCTLIIGVAIRMVPVALVVAFLMLIAPRMLLSAMVRRRKLLMQDQLVLASRGLADALRAQLSLPKAVEEVGTETPRPLGDELLRMAAQFNRGRPLAEALREAKDRIDIDGFTLMANALLIAEQRSGAVSQAMEKISRTLQENQRLDRKMQADTAAGRSSINTLAIFPAGFLIFMAFFDPDGTALLFTTLIGQIVLAGAALCVFASLAWANLILHIE